MEPTILAVGGSDPAGGAGIQADLKTLTVLGVYGAAAITCVTVQNSRGVSRIHPLAPDLVAAQVRAVLEDHRVTHIKIGMVGTAEIAMALARVLDGYRGEVILDPVLRATTGQGLTSNEGTVAMRDHLLPRVTVLTPNLDEVFPLAGPESGDAGVIDCARHLLDQYPRMNCVVVKGGHGSRQDGLIEDFCILRRETVCLTHPAIDTTNSHGTGCTLASSFAAFHLKTKSYTYSFKKSISIVQALLNQNRHQVCVRNPTGKGPLLHERLREMTAEFPGSVS